jgi:hypothetical protein
MNTKRFFGASCSIFLFALIWNGIIHLIILREAESVLSMIGREASDRSLLLSLLATLLLAMVFVWSYSRYARRGTMLEGMTHGFFFGILAGILVDLNQYILYPIPAYLAFLWFVFGMVEFCMYGIIASRIYRNVITAASSQTNNSE